MRIAVVRGPYLNTSEMANFVPLAKRHTLKAFSSLFPLDACVGFPVTRLPSPTDFPNRLFGSPRIKMGVLNRIFGDACILFGLEARMGKLYREGKGFDIAHGAETYFSFTHQCLNAKERGWVKKVVVTVWENIPHNNESIWGRKTLKKRALSQVDCFIAVTETAKKALLAEGCQEERIHVIPMGVDISKFSPYQPKKAKKERIILFVGRFEEEKGILDIFNAFRNIVRNNERKKNVWKLHLIGTGNKKKEIEDLVTQNCMTGRVHIEKRPYEKMPSVYREADIFVLPSKSSQFWKEQYGMVLVEAMASGLPIISTHSGAIPEVVGDAGILVEEGNSRHLANALQNLMDNRSVRKSWGQKARKRAISRYDAEKAAKKIEELYSSVLK